MKKTVVFITLAFLSISFVQAQDNKPTKEQTVAFIKSFFKDLKVGTIVRYSIAHNMPYWKIVDNYKIEVNDCTLTIEYDTYEKFPEERFAGTRRLVIDLKDIETIAVSLDNRAVCQYSILFKTVNKKNSIKKKKADGYENVYEGEILFHATTDIEDVAEEQMKMVKAFNHLRKLCGAPEPISFD